MTKRSLVLVLEQITQERKKYGNDEAKLSFMLCTRREERHQTECLKVPCESRCPMLHQKRRDRTLRRGDSEGMHRGRVPDAIAGV